MIEHLDDHVPDAPSVRQDHHQDSPAIVVLHRAALLPEPIIETLGEAHP
jgi:hypothetical protein